MKLSPAAIATLPPAQLELAFQHLTAARLAALEASLGSQATDTAAATLAVVMLRWRVHRILDKRVTFGDVNAALEQHGWRTAIDEMKAQAGSSKEQLWEALMEHEMTAYVPVQCQACGHRVPDETTPGCSDKDVGISEVEPMEGERLLVRSGWYRGPRGPVVFSLKCPACSATSRWFRSSAASVTLNPARWGRLCGEQVGYTSDLFELGRVCLVFGSHTTSYFLTCLPHTRYFLSRIPTSRSATNEMNGCTPTCATSGSMSAQEDARSALALHLGVPLRVALPLDWDHVWSEYRRDDGAWAIREGAGDAPAANFAARLDEGIGAWSSVLVIGSADDPLLSADVTEEYLACTPDGRADADIAAEMPRFMQTVQAARADATGSATQAKSVNGHLVYVKAGLTPAQVTAILRRAVEDHGKRAWWMCDDEY